MKYNNITAMITVQALKRVQKRLREINVPGVSVYPVSGYGEYKNFFRQRWGGRHNCVRVYAPVEQTDKIVTAIIEAAHTGIEGDGIVVVSAVDGFFRIRDKSQMD